MPDEVAGEGQIFVCAACGKTSETRFGNGKHSRGWDESCMLNAVLCWKDKVKMDGDKALEVTDGGVVQEKENGNAGGEKPADQAPDGAVRPADADGPRLA